MRSTPVFPPRMTFRYRLLAIPSGSITPPSHRLVQAPASIIPNVPASPAGLPLNMAAHEPELRLRGGASKKRLGDDERVPRLTWYFAGGVGKPPTGRELREWKRKDREQNKKRTGKSEEGFLAAFIRAMGSRRKSDKKKGTPNTGGQQTQMTGGGGATQMTDGGGETAGGSTA